MPAKSTPQQKRLAHLFLALSFALANRFDGCISPGCGAEYPATASGHFHRSKLREIWPWRPNDAPSPAFPDGDHSLLIVDCCVVGGGHRRSRALGGGPAPQRPQLEDNGLNVSERKNRRTAAHEPRAAIRKEHVHLSDIVEAMEQREEAAVGGFDCRAAASPSPVPPRNHSCDVFLPWYRRLR